MSKAYYVLELPSGRLHPGFVQCFRNIAWTVKPRGTHYAQVDEFEIDIFKVGHSEMPWRWNLLHTESRRYETSGYSLTLEDAKLTSFSRAMIYAISTGKS